MANLYYLVWEAATSLQMTGASLLMATPQTKRMWSQFRANILYAGLRLWQRLRPRLLQ